MGVNVGHPLGQERREPIRTPQSVNHLDTVSPHLADDRWAVHLFSLQKNGLINYIILCPNPLWRTGVLFFSKLGTILLIQGSTDRQISIW